MSFRLHPDAIGILVEDGFGIETDGGREFGIGRLAAIVPRQQRRILPRYLVGDLAGTPEGVQQSSVATVRIEAYDGSRANDA